jgi:tripartite ATP-independent transporter DctP family solute receptor
MKRWGGLLVAALVLSAVCLLAVGTPAAQAGETYKLKIANWYAPNHPVNIALKEKFLPAIKEGTGGKVEGFIYDSSQLGGEREFTEGVRIGTIEMAITGGILTASYPKIGVLELPYLFRDYDHVQKALYSPVGEEFVSEYQKAGVRVLAWMANGFRVISNSKRPINSLKDIAGIRLRMPENKIYVETGKALGFSVVTMGMPEVFNALKQGVMDGQENPFSTLWASGWWEVQKYVTVSYHLFSYNGVSINDKLYQSMPKDYQGVIAKAARSAAEYQFKLLQDDEKDVIKKLEGKGLQISYPDRKPFEDATKVVRDNYVKGYAPAKELIERIMAVK